MPHLDVLELDILAQQDCEIIFMFTCMVATTPQQHFDEQNFDELIVSSIKRERLDESLTILSHAHAHAHARCCNYDFYICLVDTDVCSHLLVVVQFSDSSI